MPLRFANLLKTYLHLENYGVRIADMLRLLPRGKVVEYRLRKGPRYLVRTGTADGSHVVDVTREGEYFRYFGIQPGDVVMDIGANIGSFSVYAAWKEPSARVIALEPVQENFDLLARNARHNGLSNLEPIRAGVMDKPGEIVIHHGGAGREGSHSVIEMGGVHGARTETVPCLAFSELMEKVPRCDFMKIDCEGAEFDFLPEAPREALAKIRKLAMEYHDYRRVDHHKVLVERLEREGFRIFLKPDPGRKTGMIFAVRERDA